MKTRGLFDHVMPVFLSFKYSGLGLCDVLNISVLKMIKFCWVDIEVIYFLKLKE